MAQSYFEHLAAEVEIPPGGTLSRVLVKEGALRLVLFAFDAGEELTEHTSALPVVIQAISGQLTVGWGSERRRIGPGGWLYLEAGEPHSVLAEEPSRMLLTMIRCS